jgi:hypothetical protein
MSLKSSDTTIKVFITFVIEIAVSHTEAFPTTHTMLAFTASNISPPPTSETSLVSFL